MKGKFPMAKKNDLDAAVAGGNQQGRHVVGGAGPSYSSAAPKTGKLVAKGHAKNSMADPSVNTSTHRAPVAQPAAERMGGAYRVVVSNGYAQPNAVEASATQGNGRVLKSSLDRGRSHGTFNDGPTIGY